MEQYKFTKNKELKTEKQTTLTLLNQKNLILSGVEEVYSSNDKTIYLKTNGKKLQILGENINISKLSLDSGELEASGLFYNFKYFVNVKTSFFKRFFK